jgi:hypothetical protein
VIRESRIRSATGHLYGIVVKAILVNQVVLLWVNHKNLLNPIVRKYWFGVLNPINNQTTMAAGSTLAVFSAVSGGFGFRDGQQMASGNRRASVLLSKGAALALSHYTIASRLEDGRSHGVKRLYALIA